VGDPDTAPERHVSTMALDPGDSGKLIELPAHPLSPVEVALEDLQLVYVYLYRRVGNRADSEDLTQQVALKAIPRLRPDADPHSVRGYLFATARTELAAFWATRFGLPEEELHEDMAIHPDSDVPLNGAQATERIRSILHRLPDRYARLLELRFLHGYAIKEVAAELGTSVGGARIMQLRALRAAAKVARDV
jgi:RNA polymerase sigma factor (sigma-70 family)